MQLGRKYFYNNITNRINLNISKNKRKQQKQAFENQVSIDFEELPSDVFDEESSFEKLVSQKGRNEFSRESKNKKFNIHTTVFSNVDWNKFSIFNHIRNVLNKFGYNDVCLSLGEYATTISHTKTDNKFIRKQKNWNLLSNKCVMINNEKDVENLVTQ